MDIKQDSYISFVNLDHRGDRLVHMLKELSKIDIRAERTRGFYPEEVKQPEYKLRVMKNRTPGAIGCHYSQIEIMSKALLNGKHAWVMEDDLIFCDDFNERLKLIEQFLDSTEWDVFWFGGTYHLNATWHKNPHPNDMRQCTCSLDKDYEFIDDFFVRTYGCWGTYCYLVNNKSLLKVLDFLDAHVHESMGIDWLFILMQPHIKAYAFNPGCVKQMDNKSDIGNGMTYFSGFETLGPHWFQNKLS